MTDARRLLPFAVPAAAVALELRGLVFEPGIPEFRHDWIWPGLRTQCASELAGGFTAWVRDGLGAPALYPESPFFHLPAGLSCTIFGPRIGLIVLVAVILAAAAIGAARLAQTLARGAELELSTTAVAGIAAFYAANPIVLNELQAGHVKFLAAYALLPFLAASASRLSRRSGWAVTGLLLGFAALQPQFLPFGICIVASFAAYANALQLRPFIGAIALAGAMNAPLFAPLIAHASLTTLDVLKPLEVFERIQSAGAGSALRLIGYTAGYDLRLLPAWLQYALWVIPAAAAYGCIAVRRGWMLGLPACAGVLVASAWYNPFQPLFSWLFANVASFAIFREVYNAQCMTACAYIAGIALAYAASRSSRLRSNALSAALIVCALSCAYFTTQDIPHYEPSAAEAGALRALAQSPGSWRYLTSPATYPLRNERLPEGAFGYSPFALSIGDHPTAFSPIQSDVEMYTAASLRERRDVADLLRRQDVGALVHLTGWTSASIESTEPSVARSERALLEREPPETMTGIDRVNSARVAVEPYSAGPSSLDMRYAGTRALDVISGGTPLPLQNFYDDPDPHKSWARTALAPQLPSWAFAEPLNVFSLAPRMRVPIERGIVLAGDTDGKLVLNGCERRATIDAHFALFRCTREPVASGTPPLVLSAAVLGGTLAAATAPEGAAGSADILSADDWRVRAHIRAVKGSALVLREGCSAGWKLDVDNATHVCVDGYANAWILPENLDSTVTIEYGPARLYLLALLTAAAAIAVGLFFALRKPAASA